MHDVIVTSKLISEFFENKIGARFGFEAPPPQLASQHLTHEVQAEGVCQKLPKKNQLHFMSWNASLDHSFDGEKWQNFEANAGQCAKKKNFWSNSLIIRVNLVQGPC